MRCFYLCIFGKYNFILRTAPAFMEDDLGVIDSGDDEGGVGRKKRRRK